MKQKDQQTVACICKSELLEAILRRELLGELNNADQSLSDCGMGLQREKCNMYILGIFTVVTNIY